jgi:hypothetical protein
LPAGALAQNPADFNADALPQSSGKASPVIEALHSCTTRASSGNMNQDSRKAFVMECVNNNLGQARSSVAVAPDDQRKDCEAVAAYLRLSGSEKDNWVSACQKPQG